MGLIWECVPGWNEWIFNQLMVLYMRISWESMLVVPNGGDSLPPPPPQGTFLNVWGHLWLSQLVGSVVTGIWQKPTMLLSILQCTSPSLIAKTIQLKMPLVQTSRGQESLDCVSLGALFCLFFQFLISFFKMELIWKIISNWFICYLFILTSQISLISLFCLPRN